MSPPKMKIASLDTDKLARVQSLEKDLGVNLVAVESSSPYAPLSGEQLNRIKALEKELNIILLAYAPRP